MSVVPARRAFNRLSRERRVSDITAAARAVFAEHGYESASMAAIAAEAGIVEGTIYKYFDNKRDLLQQVLAQWYEEMVADQARQLAGITGTRNRLRFLVRRHLQTIADEAALCRVFFVEVRSDAAYHASVLHRLNRSYTRPALDVLQEGVRSGELREDLPVRLVRDLLYGAIEHHTWNYVCGRGSLPVDELADRLLNLVLGGIAARPADEAAPAIARLERVAERLERAVAGQLR